MALNLGPDVVGVVVFSNDREIQEDTIVANGTYPYPVKDHVVPCSDGAAVVVELGSNVESLQVADRVVVNFDMNNLSGLQPGSTRESLGGNLDGVLRQYITLPAEVLSKVPEECNLTLVQMASLVASGVTAWNALFGLLPLKAGQTVLFQGEQFNLDGYLAQFTISSTNFTDTLRGLSGTGGVSTIGLQLAKAAGATTIVTSSSNEKLKFVQDKFGADHVINFKTYPNWAAVANEITHGRGVDVILENGGSGTIRQSIEAIKLGGLIAVIGFLSPAKQEDMPDVPGLLIGKACILRGIAVGTQRQLRELVDFVNVHNIQPSVQKTFGFSRDQVVDAFDYLQTGRHIGKMGIEVTHAE
ncbi:unnamed protein product [Phytophthora lilii]|uniref:Unnamed protein product n=1 Tax=Phytophthora lilii TaxID=2077276 RepID=A0A9W6WU71_9STRA|nr:unnamed protein product [Phytophthora lilii]